MTTTLNYESEINADGTTNWEMALANALDRRCPCTDESDIEWFTQLTVEVVDYFGGDTAAAVEAVRTGTLAFKFADGTWWI